MLRDCRRRVTVVVVVVVVVGNDCDDGDAPAGEQQLQQKPCISSLHNDRPSEASIPPTTMHGAIPPPLFSRLKPHSLSAPPPQTIFGHCIYAILCNNFMRVFSGFWKLSVRNNDPKMPKKNKKNGVGKTHCMVSFLSDGGIKRDRASAVSEKIFEQMIGKTK